MLVDVPSFVQRVQDSFCHVGFKHLTVDFQNVTTLTIVGRDMQRSPTFESMQHTRP